MFYADIQLEAGAKVTRRHVNTVFDAGVELTAAPDGPPSFAK